MKASRNAYDLIKDSEGLRLTPYKCPAGKWTVGWGHTGADVVPGKSITLQEAEELLARDVAVCEAQVNSRGWTLTQGQFDAVVDLVFNLGFEKVRNSTLFAMLDQKDYVGAHGQFSRWVYSGGKPLPGLLIRRARAASLFRSALHA